LSKGLPSINISVPRGQIRAIIEFIASYVQHRATYWLNKNYSIVHKGLLRDLPKGHNYVQHRATYWLNKNYSIVYKGLLRDLPKGHNYVQHRPTYWLNKNYSIVYKGLLRDLPKGRNYVQHRPTYPKVHVSYLKAMLFNNYVGYDMGYVAYLRSIV